MMDKILGIYKNKEVEVKFNADYLLLGDKRIRYNKIYHIEEGLVSEYNAIISVALVVSPTVLFALLSLLILNSFSAFFIFSGIAIGLIAQYIIYPRAVNKNNDEIYCKVIDIYYKDSFDSVIVQGIVKFDYSKLHLEKKTFFQKRVLQRYISRVVKSRKYLIQLLEASNQVNYQNLYEKYSVVAKSKYQLDTIMTMKMIEVMCEGYLLLNKKYLKIAFRLARFSLISTILIIVYLLVKLNLSYQSFF